MDTSKRRSLKSDSTDPKTYAGQIAIIKQAFRNPQNNEGCQESKMAAIKMLQELVLSDIENIQQDILCLLEEIEDELIKKEICHCVQDYIALIIVDCNFEAFKKLFGLWKNFNFDKFMEIAKSALKQKGEHITKFLIKCVFPQISRKQSKAATMQIIEIAKFLSNFVESEPSDTELNTLVSNLPLCIDQLNKEDTELSQEFVDFLLKYLKLKIFHPKFEKSLIIILSNEILKNLFVTHVKSYLLISIIQSENHLKLIEHLYIHWKKYDLPMFGEVIKEVLKKKSNILVCKTFYLESLVHTVMQPPSSEISLDTRDVLIEVAFEFAAYLPVSWWLAEEYEKFLKNISGETGYAKNILALSVSKYENWHKLWMFLVRILGKKLHKNTVLINRLLSIVEKGFKNSNSAERIKSYDCWKELIDNMALDKNYITSSKQIRLLLTTLQAKLSKNEPVIIKRFEVFVYLLEQLQSSGVLILKSFLEFCFGDVGENKDPIKSGGGTINVPRLWSSSVKVLMAIVGHCHREKDQCLCSDDVIKLHNRIITQNNISTHYYHVLRSVAECSKLLKDAEFDSRRNTILDCLWRSTMNIVLSSQSDKRPQFLDLFGKILEDFLRDEDCYNNDIANVIFKVAMGMDPGKTTDFVINNLNQILKIVFTVPMQEQGSSIEVEKLCLILFNAQKLEKLNQIKKDVFNAFTTFKTCEKNANFVAEIWVNLASELEDYGEGKSFDYLLWPAVHLHHLEPNGKIKIDLIESYRALVSCHVEKQKDLHVCLFSGYKKVLKRNPLLANNIMSLIEIFSYNLHNLEILNHTLEIFSQILILPNNEIADSHNINNVQSFIKNCLTSSEFSKLNDSTTVENFLKCVEYLFKNKHYGCVEDLEMFIKNLSESVQFLYSKYLPVDLFMDIFHKETDARITSSIYKVVDRLRNVKDPSVVKSKSPFPMGGRSARIANMAKSCPQAVKNESSPSGLRLFGKNVDTLSPLDVKGSILKNTPTKTPTIKKLSSEKFVSPSPKSKKYTSIMDESTSEFVSINTEVKVQPDKLTEHQKETLKRRREDIPALYEDLSQSQSQSLTSLIDLDKSKIKSPEYVEIRQNQRTELQKGASCNKSEDTLVELTNKNKKAIDFSEDIFPETEDIKQQESTSNNDQQILDNETEKDEETKKELRMQTELKKLQMDIVGADEYFSPGRPKRTRKSLLPEKSDKQNKKSNKEKISEKVLDKNENNKTHKVSNKNDEKRRNSVITGKNRTPKGENVDQRKSVDNVNIQEKKKKKIPDVETQTQTSLPAEVNEVDDAPLYVVATSQTDMLRDEPQLQQIIVENGMLEQRGLIENSLDQAKTPKKSDRKSNIGKALELAKKKPSESLEKSDKQEVPQARTRQSIIKKKELKSPGEIQTPNPTVKCDDSLLDSTKSIKKEHSNLPRDLLNLEPSVSNPGPYFSPLCRRRRDDNRNVTEIEKENDETVEENVPKSGEEAGSRGQKRPLAETDSEEDVIESSQESVAPSNTSKTRNLSRLSGFLLNGSKNTSSLNQSNDSKSNKRSDIVDEKTISVEDLMESIHRVDKTDDADSSKVEENSSKNAKKDMDSPITKDLKVYLENIDMADTTEGIKDLQCGVQSIDTENHDVQMQDTQTQDTQTQGTQTQDTQTQNTQTQDETESYDPSHLDKEKMSEDIAAVLQLEIPKKPELTDSEKIMSRMDTETLTETDLNKMLDSSNDTIGGDKAVEAGDLSVPKEDSTKNIEDAVKNTSEGVEDSQETQIESPERNGSLNQSSDLPSSPVTGDTPNRTNELLTSTSDISPIGSRSMVQRTSSDLIDSSFIGIVPVALKFDEEDQDHNASEKSPKKSEDDAPKITPELSRSCYVTKRRRYNPIDDNSTIKSEKENDEITSEIEDHEKPQQKMIEETLPVESAVMEVDNHIEVIKEGKCISDRSTKLFELVKEGSASHRVINKPKPQGLSMSPSASRIKKLMSNMKSTSVSTAAENVKNEDFLTFSREVPSPLAVPRSSILKRKHPEMDEGSFSPLAKRKRVNFSDPCTTSKKVFIKDDNHAANLLDDENISLHKELFGESPGGGGDNFSETEGLETEQSAQIVNATMLRRDHPIYPGLVDCPADVAIIVKKVTSPMFVNNLLSKLKSKGIKTIGELANLSEAEVNRYPFKTPVVANVRKALDEYCKKNMSKSLNDIDLALVKGGLKDSMQNATAGPSVEFKKSSPRKKLVLFKEPNRDDEIEEQQNEEDDMTIEQLSELVISALETKKILERVKGRVNLQIQDVIESKDYPEAAREIIKTLGVSEVLNILMVVIRDHPKHEEVYYDRMILDSAKQPLEKFLRVRSLEDIRKALWKCVEDGYFTEKEVFNTVFLSSASVTLLNPFFDRLTAVDLENVVFNRLKGEDFDSFAMKIIEKHPVNTSEVVKKLKIEELSPEEIIMVFSKLLKADCLKEDHLIKIMKMTSSTMAERLPPKILMNHYIECLRNLSNFVKF